MTDDDDCRATVRPATDVTPRGVLILLGLAAATITVTGLKAGAAIIAPILLALVLVITAYPVRRWLASTIRCRPLSAWSSRSSIPP